jgi:GTPase SAR1 family protein
MTPYSQKIWETERQDECDWLRPLSYSGTKAILLVFHSVADQWIRKVKHDCPTTQIIVIATNSQEKESTKSSQWLRKEKVAPCDLL